MSNGSKVAVIITIIAFVAIIFFSIVYYNFSDYLTATWDYALSQDFLNTIITFFYSFWAQIALITLIALVIIVIAYFFKSI
jgi:hypothetical protein